MIKSLLLAGAAALALSMTAAPASADWFSGWMLDLGGVPGTSAGVHGNGNANGVVDHDTPDHLGDKNRGAIRSARDAAEAAQEGGNDGGDNGGNGGDGGGCQR